MRIKETATFKRYALECMVRMEMAKDIESRLTDEDNNPEMKDELVEVCKKNGLDLNGDILGKYYINAERGLLYDLAPSKPDFVYEGSNTEGDLVSADNLVKDSYDDAIDDIKKDIESLKQRFDEVVDK